MARSRRSAGTPDRPSCRRVSIHTGLRLAQQEEAVGDEAESAEQQHREEQEGPGGVEGVGAAQDGVEEDDRPDRAGPPPQGGVGEAAAYRQHRCLRGFGPGAGEQRAAEAQHAGEQRGDDRRPEQPGRGEHVPGDSTVQRLLGERSSEHAEERRGEERRAPEPKPAREGERADEERGEEQPEVAPPRGPVEARLVPPAQGPDQHDGEHRRQDPEQVLEAQEDREGPLDLRGLSQGPGRQVTHVRDRSHRTERLATEREAEERQRQQRGEQERIAQREVLHDERFVLTLPEALPRLVDVVEDRLYALLADAGAVLNVPGALQVGEGGLGAALDAGDLRLQPPEPRLIQNDVLLAVVLPLLPQPAPQGVQLRRKGLALHLAHPPVLPQLEDDVRHLRREELLHRQPHRVPGARQAGQKLLARGARRRAAQHRGGPDLLVGEHPEELAEPVEPLVYEPAHHLVGRIARGDAGAARGDDRVHVRVRKEPLEDLPYLRGVVAHDFAVRDFVPGPFKSLDDDVAAGVGLGGAGVAYGEDGDPDLLGRRVAVPLDALAQNAPPRKNGLVTRSRPIVVSGPCPERTRVSSGKVKSLSEMLLMRTSMLPPGRSTLPTLPAKSASPEKTRPSSSTKNVRCPGAWPGVYMERSRKDPTSRTSSSPTCRSTLGILPNLMPIIIACWGTVFSIASASACMRTGHIYSSTSWATAPTWSMWEW